MQGILKAQDMIDHSWQIVLWGFRPGTRPYHSHTHIHYAWDKAFRHLGYHVLWLNDGDDVRDIGFERTLFITSGGVNQEDTKIPLRKDCFYVIHNCDLAKYKDYPYLRTQTYTDSILRYRMEKLEECMYFDNDCLYLMWATDLLPHEIEKNKPDHIDLSLKNDYFVGTVGLSSSNSFGNSDELLKYKLACDKEGIAFWFKGGFSGDPVSPEENQRLIQQALYAPAIVGKWQAEVGYVPCRAFKSVAYGKWLVTNSHRSYELFEGKAVYNEDCYRLFYDARDRMYSLTLKELHEQMDWVAERHTYLNRISVLLDCVNRRL